MTSCPKYKLRLPYTPRPAREEFFPCGSAQKRDISGVFLLKADSVYAFTKYVKGTTVEKHAYLP